MDKIIITRKKFNRIYNRLIKEKDIYHDLRNIGLSKIYFECTKQSAIKYPNNDLKYTNYRNKLFKQYVKKYCILI